MLNHEKKLVNQITDFDIKLIRLFKTVAECGSYTAAESVVGITKSAISLQMSDLERRLGMKLCHRGRGGVTLTDEGALVLESSEALLASIEDFRNNVNQINHELRGQLNIALVNNLVTQPKMLITNTLKNLRQLSDNININITMTTPEDIEKGISDGRFHLGAMPIQNRRTGLEYHSLYREYYNLYCSSEHELFSADDITVEDLRKSHTIITRNQIDTKAYEIHQKLRCTATASDHEGVAFLILTGQYIGFLPEHYAASWVNEHKMLKLLPELFKFSSEINLISKKGIKRNQIVSEFINLVDMEG